MSKKPFKSGDFFAALTTSYLNDRSPGAWKTIKGKTRLIKKGKKK